jgi:hypothetical protein
LKDAEYAMSRRQECLDSLPSDHWGKPWDVARLEFIKKMAVDNSGDYSYIDRDKIKLIIFYKLSYRLRVYCNIAALK